MKLYHAINLHYLCAQNEISMKNLKGKRVAALLSGGVDSSVAVAALVEQGIRPDLWYIQIGPERDTTDIDTLSSSSDVPTKHESAHFAQGFTCTIEEDLEMAQAVAAKYRLPLQVIDLHKDYWDKVVDYTISQVRQGLTPNPDVMCNRLIKFGVFDERVGKDYDIIATGHYATTEEDEEGRTWLCTSPDPVKDQTDFLAQLQPWQLQKACFPIGHLPKSEVRAIAEREHLSAAHRKDSQGICFLGKINYNDYIRKYLGDNPGQVIDRNTGKVLGMHRGLWFHTIGQRKGLGFGGGPWYVVEKDMDRNILWVVNGYDPIDSYSDHFLVTAPHWLTMNPFDKAKKHGTQTEAEGTSTKPMTIKIRHTPDFCPAEVTLLSDGRLAVHTERPLQGVAPGQFAVLYDLRKHRCFGSGEIRLKS